MEWTDFVPWWFWGGLALLYLLAAELGWWGYREAVFDSGKPSDWAVKDEVACVLWAIAWPVLALLMAIALVANHIGRVRSLW